MSKELRMGFIGLDTSHVSTFSKLLNDPNNEHHVPGGRIVAAFPGGSADFPLSINRVEGYTKELKEQWGVEIMESPEAVAEVSDLVFIESVDGRVHLDQFQRIVGYKKPTFIDKPLATNLKDAQMILRLAGEAGVAVMSCSSLRYSEELANILKRGREGIIGCDVFGPMNEEPTLPGLFWYGCHSVEMMVTVMGLGCREVRCVRNEDNDLLTAVWGDGRVASFRGVRNAHAQFGLTLHYKDRAQFVNASAGRPYYAGLLAAIVDHLPKNTSDVPSEEMLHVVQIIEAANLSRIHDGKPVQV